MTKLILCTMLLLGLQSVSAEEVPPPADATTASVEDVQLPKSFFETRTFDEIQQEVKADASFITDGSADMSSTVGG